MKPDELICVYCGRIGRRLYSISSGNPHLEPGRTSYRCTNTASCEDRQTSGKQQCLADEPDGHRCPVWVKDPSRLCQTHWMPPADRAARRWQ